MRVLRICRIFSDPVTYYYISCHTHKCTQCTCVACTYSHEHACDNLLDFTEWVKFYFIKYIMYFSSARVAGLGEIFDERGSWANKLVARL